MSGLLRAGWRRDGGDPEASAECAAEDLGGVGDGAGEDVGEEPVGGEGGGWKGARWGGAEIREGSAGEFAGVLAGGNGREIDGDVEATVAVATDELLDRGGAAVVEKGGGEIAGGVQRADGIVVVDVSKSASGVLLAVGAESHPDVFYAEHAVGLPGKGEQGEGMFAGEVGDIVPGAVAQQHLLALEEEPGLAWRVEVEVPGGEVEDEQAGRGVGGEISAQGEIAGNGEAADGVGDDQRVEAKLGVDEAGIEAHGGGGVAEDEDVGVLAAGVEAEVEDGGPLAASPAIELKLGKDGEGEHAKVGGGRDEQEDDEEAAKGPHACDLREGGRGEGVVVLLDGRAQHAISACAAGPPRLRGAILWELPGWASQVAAGLEVEGA